jgi:hypothetical protein
VSSEVARRRGEVGEGNEAKKAGETGEAGEAEEAKEAEEAEEDGKHWALRPPALRSLLRFVDSSFKSVFSMPKLYFAEVGHQLQTVVVVVRRQ